MGEVESLLRVVRKVLMDKETFEKRLKVRE